LINVNRAIYIAAILCVPLGGCGGGGSGNTSSVNAGPTTSDVAAYIGAAYQTQQANTAAQIQATERQQAALGNLGSGAMVSAIISDQEAGVQSFLNAVASYAKSNSRTSNYSANSYISPLSTYENSDLNWSPPNAVGNFTTSLPAYQNYVNNAYVTTTTLINSY
jgi:hypothetical protein